MPRKKILWLCSWYPGKTEPFNGDFIQRHAQAAALYNDIHVIHVMGDTTGVIKETVTEIKKENGLTEQIVYIKKSTTAWGRFSGHYKLLYLYKDATRKYIKENGKPDLVHVHVPVKAGIFGLWMKRKYGIPYVLTEHWGIYNEVADLNYTGRNNLFKKYTKKIFEQAAKFISVSRFLAEGVNRMVIKKNYETVPNVVNTSLFFYKEKPAGASFRFIHVSNMVALKNAEGILRAFRSLQEKNSNTTLIMAGDTNDRIRQYAAEQGLSADKVIFKGEIPYQQVAEEMQQADSFILFSNIENSPCVIGEALCCGLPVIASRVGGVPELVNETNSILIEAGDENALVNAMQQMIGSRIKFNPKKIAEEAGAIFSYDVVGKRFDEIYADVR